MSIIGPAGIGKSRLGWEFVKYLDGVIEDVWWHSGRSPAYGTGISFWALGEMVRGRCHLVETDDEATSRSKIAEALAEHIADPDERRWIERAFLVLLGFESGMATEELYGAWRTFFERLAETGPVIMVFEDFHHADTGPRGLRRSRHGVVALGPDLRRDPRPAGPARQAAGVGRRQAQLHVGLSRAAHDRRDAPAAQGPRPGHARSPRLRRSWRGPTACRCTPSRRSGC